MFDNLSIFSRLVVGFVIVLLLILFVNIYILLKFRHFKHFSHALVVENKILYDQEKMFEYFSSMLRNERQYLYLKDKIFYQYFVKAEENFKKCLLDAINLTKDEEIKDLLEKIQEIEEGYLALCHEEFKNFKMTSLEKNDFNERREEFTSSLLSYLRELKTLLRKSIDNKVMELDRQGSTSIQALFFATIFAMVSILVVAAFLTRNITYPLSIIIQKTENYAKGDFKEKIEIKSPPEIKKLADSLNIMSEKLQEIDKMKSEFFALISHELRTPLTSIKEGANLLMEGIGGSLTPKQERIVNIIKEESNKLVQLVNDILDLSKMEANMMSFNFQKSDISLIIDKVCKELEPIFEANKIKLEKIINKKLPLVKIDIEKIEQALKNLLMNAIKFSPPEKEVILEAKPFEKGLLISVTDFGPGISKDQQDKIFNKFVQIKYGNKVVKGTGLGLSIVKHIIEAHGGRLWIKSEEGKGATFYLFLPV